MAAEQRHAIPGRRAVAEALRAGRRLHEVSVSGHAGGDLEDILDACAAAGVPVRRRGRDELDALAEGVRHQGVVALAPPFAYRNLAELADDADLVVLLDGVTDPQNLGSIARSAELAGAAGLVLPRRRSAHVTAAAEKASAGAFSWLPVMLVPNTTRGLQTLADRDFWSVGLAGGHEPLWDTGLLDGKAAVVIGAEGAGLSRLVTERVDGLVGIPMVGRLASLNAGVAAGIVLFEVLRRRTSRNAR